MTHRPPVRLIATDLDNTFFRDDAALPPGNLEAVREAMARGVIFAAVSGRSARLVSYLMREYGLPGARVIGCNGAEICDAPDHPVLTRSLPPAAAVAALDVLEKAGMSLWAYSEDALFLLRNERMLGRINRRLAQSGFTLLRDISAFPALAARGVRKFVVHRQDGREEDFLAAKAACGAIPGLSLTSSWHTNFEIVPEGVDKGEALAKLCAREGVAREAVLAFGDNENDLPMLAWAGRAVAVRNAEPAVLALCGDVTDACEDGGVGRAIRSALAEA